MTFLCCAAKKLSVKTTIAITSSFITIRCCRRPPSYCYGSSHVATSEHYNPPQIYFFAFIAYRFEKKSSSRIYNACLFYNYPKRLIQPCFNSIIRIKNVFARGFWRNITFCNNRLNHAPLLYFKYINHDIHQAIPWF